MATASREHGPDLSADRIRRLLAEEPFRVRFFQAVRLLERLAPDRRPVGLFVSPESEVVRFSALPSLAFPASEVHSIRPKADGSQEMVVQFMGLSAALGVLPHAYTEMLLERMRAKDHAPRAFFDLFNHRVISLFYRSWEKYRFYVAYERDRTDPLSSLLESLVGLGTGDLAERTGLPRSAPLYYAGLLAQRPPSAVVLRQILEDYFEVRVHVEQFAGMWHRLPREDRTRFGEGDMRFEQLGIGTVVGDEVWDQSSIVRLRLGPMPLASYLDFLPGGDAWRHLCAWLRLYANRQFVFEVQLVLERADVPPCEIGGAGAGQPRLGRLSWICNRPMRHDPSDVVYRVE